MNALMGCRDQVIVVTGASKGIGLGTAASLVARGARVALLARGEARLRAAVASLPADQVIAITADVTRRSELAAAFQQVWDRWGRFDGIVNNVGFQFARRIELMPEDEVRQLIEHNLVATIFGCQAAIPFLRRNGGGRIVNISSSSVRDHYEFPHIGLYSACKAAVERLSMDLREEHRADHIRVTVFSSGSVFTGGIEKFDQDAAQEALAVWKTRGAYYSGSTTPEIMGYAIAQVFEYPREIAAEFVEVRPGLQMEKLLEDRPES